MKLWNENDVPTPPTGEAIVFRRLLDGRVYYKNSNGEILPCENDGGSVFTISSVAELLNITRLRDFTEEKMVIIKQSPQEIIFELKNCEVIQKITYAGGGGGNGRSGISGYSGYSGYSGQDGGAGASGISGYSGYSGFSGFSGFSGYSGISGYSGYSGYSGSAEGMYYWQMTSFNPADATTYHVGPAGNAQTTDTNRQFIAPFSFTISEITIVSIPTLINGSAGTSAFSWKNITTATTTALGNISFTQGAQVTRTSTFSGLAIVVTAGDAVVIQWDTPTWATNPTGLVFSIYIKYSV